MNSNRHLKVSFSNGENWDGSLSVEFAKSRVDIEYPDANIEVVIYEVAGDEQFKGTVLPKLRRVNGNWIEI